MLVCSLLASCGVLTHRHPSPSEEDRDRLSTLRQGHPRILATEDDFERARRFAEDQELGQRWLANLTAEAEDLLGKPPVEYAHSGPRMLAQCRTACERVKTLAMAYRLTGNRRFADRAVEEMLNAAAFPDWNPSHFLDTAEMTHGMAIGYDWLYDVLSEEQREKIRSAIVQKGLRQAIPEYRDQRWWSVATHNWNQVCNGSMVMGALAVADVEPDLAAWIIGQALESVPRAMASYAPDGAWPEGPSYWHYATRYTVYLIAALESALGSDFGISKAKGFSRTGRFAVYATGPTGKMFNFGDGSDGNERLPDLFWLGREYDGSWPVDGDGSGPIPELFWLSRRFDDPLLAWEERRRAGDHGTPLDILWYDGRGEGPAAQKAPLDALFRGVAVAFFRSAWEDPDAIYVGFRAGDNRANHSHLDLGNFVLDALGERWAVDLGAEDYNLPGYWDPQKRFTYFRLKTVAHNTLTFGGENQEYTARAVMTEFGSAPGFAYAIADLTQGYRKWALSVRRGVAMVGRRSVLVQDEVRCVGEQSPEWGMLTGARVELAGARRAVLRQGGKSLTAQILSPGDAVFAVETAERRPPERENRGVSRLVVRLPRAVEQATIAVLLAPGEHRLPRPTVRPLDAWGKSGASPGR
ncbi:MAG: DUF4962 domain-containing protein [Armatimonadota bacterium]